MRVAFRAHDLRQVAEALALIVAPMQRWHTMPRDVVVALPCGYMSAGANFKGIAGAVQRAGCAMACFAAAKVR